MMTHIARVSPIVLLLGLVLLVAGCDPVVGPFEARIVPSEGRVPFEAVIRATPVPEGNYRFELPDGTVESDSPDLTVTVDALEWEATVLCFKGATEYEASVSAHGTNALPHILRPMIGNTYRTWPTLTPLERTLIICRVDYSGDWALVAAEFDCERTPEPDSIYCPPLERDERGRIVFHVYGTENAFLVYPTRVAPSPEGLPYRPTPYEEGYPFRSGWSGNIYYMAGFPQQNAILTLTVEDDWGRQTSQTFEVWVGAKFGDYEYEYTSP
jgi:hypothetical protein